MADLLSLALRALEDADVLPVLGDAVIEANRYDPRVGALLLRGHPYRFDTMDQQAMNLAVGEEVAAPTDRLARAIAAVELLAGWPESWPLALGNARRFDLALAARFDTVMGYFRSGIIGPAQAAELLGVPADMFERTPQTGGDSR